MFGTGFPSNLLMIHILLLSLLVAGARAEMLFESGSTWRWRPGITEASDPPSAWRELDFNDSEFSTAPAPFWYGDPYAGGTEISGMQNVYLCLFLRKSFVVTNVSEIAAVQLSAVVDDGFVAWINGTEVQRVNMPDGSGIPVSTTTLAQNAVEPVAFETYELASPATYLVPGTNMIAVQVFQSSLGSSDIGYDCSLEAIYREPPPDIPPAVAAVNPPPGSTVRSLPEVTVLFNKAVTGVDAADLVVNGQPALLLTVISPSQYLFTLPSLTAGLIELRWVTEAGIRELDSQMRSFAGGAWTYNMDPKAAEHLPYISEFMAANSRTLADESSEYPDWLEIYNPGSAPLNLEGWALTDSTNSLSKWRFPATNLASGKFLVVFASEKDKSVPGTRLHTNFKLGADGEYLALVSPDGRVASQFGPRYPSQVTDVSFGVAQLGEAPFTASTEGLYFTRPTPGEANVAGTVLPGPAILDPQHTPSAPKEDDDLWVTVRVIRSFYNVASVMLHYRVMFGPEVSVAMFDDGVHADGAANDGIFGASIPANASTTSQMVRYYITSSDAIGNPSRWPLFTDRNSTAEYLGTVINSAYVTSSIPVIHLFAPPSILQPGPNTSSIGADSQNGSRGVSVFYDGEFYDNVYVALRGNTTAGYPKKSHRFEFNREHPFRHPGVGWGWPERSGPRLRKTSFVADYPDPTYMRQGLSFWLCQEIGSPASFYYPVRLQLNGQFYQLANHNDVHGEELLDRLGYDSNGALYNAIGTLETSRSSTGGFEKKTRTWDGDSDYEQLADAIAEPVPAANRRANVFEMLDLPNVISYLVAARFVQENDDVWANMSIYHDNDGDNLWRIVSFDMNLSWGAFYYDNPQYDNGIQAVTDSHKSFPLYGSSQALSLTEGNYNRMYDVIFDVPQTLEMFRRRMRTVLDRYVLPPGSPAGASPIEQKILAWRDRIVSEAALDRAKWGWPGIGGQNNLAPASLPDGVNDLLNKFFYLRRQHFYGKHSVTNTSLPIGSSKTQNAGFPLPQPANSSIEVVSVEFNPLSRKQEEEFICLTNPAPYAFDISDWSVEGAVKFKFKPGTVIPSNSQFYLSPDVRAFRARSLSPRGREGRFVLGPYSGQLSARGEIIEIRNQASNLVQTFSFPGAPSAVQQFLRITEIMYHPASEAGDHYSQDDYEYIELKNTSIDQALDLSGVAFTDGIGFTFDTVNPLSLAARSSIALARNRAAFIEKFGTTRTVAGQFTGALDNSGERLRLLDAFGEEVLDFTYNNSWYPETDGQGASLIIVDETTDPDLWSEKAAWKASGDATGADNDHDGLPDAWELAHGLNPLLNDASADKDGDGMINYAEFVAGTDPNDRTSVLRLNAQVLARGATLQFFSLTGRTYTIEFTDSLAGSAWQKLADFGPSASSQLMSVGDSRESPHRFYRLITPKR